MVLGWWPVFVWQAQQANCNDRGLSLKWTALLQRATVVGAGESAECDADEQEAGHCIPYA